MGLCGLQRFSGELASHVPDGPDRKTDFVFHAGVLPVPPANLSSDRIVIRKGTHDYNSWYRADALWMELGPRKCRELGVFLLACAFHGPGERATLTLDHPGSAIHRIVIERDQSDLDDCPLGLSTVPLALRYLPAETKCHPWVGEDVSKYDLPRLALSNAGDCVGASVEDWHSRDTVWISARHPGTFRLAELLLNAGCSWNAVREYSLEGDAGYRGVAPMSAELRIFLPGSDGWIHEGDDLTEIRG